MPPLASIALHYLIWMIGLSVINQLAVVLLGLPPSQTVVIMLAAVPALPVAQRVVQQATRALTLVDWAIVWSVMLVLYAVYSVGIWALLSAQVRAGLSSPDVMGQIATVLGAVAAMLALFLFIGQLMARRER